MMDQSQMEVQLIFEEARLHIDVLMHALSHTSKNEKINYISQIEKIDPAISSMIL